VDIEEGVIAAANTGRDIISERFELGIVDVSDGAVTDPFIEAMTVREKEKFIFASCSMHLTFPRIKFGGRDLHYFEWNAPAVCGNYGSFIGAKSNGKGAVPAVLLPDELSDIDHLFLLHRRLRCVAYMGVVLPDDDFCAG